MSKLNNKGQTLLLFVILLPVFILMAAVMIDLTIARNNKIKLDNITKYVVKYGVSNINNDPYEEMVKLIYKNDDSIDKYDIDVNLEEQKVHVSIQKNSTGIFSSFIGNERYKEVSSYVGYITNEKIIVEKDD